MLEYILIVENSAIYRCFLKKNGFLLYIIQNTISTGSKPKYERKILRFFKKKKRDSLYYFILGKHFLNKIQNPQATWNLSDYKEMKNFSLSKTTI